VLRRVPVGGVVKITRPRKSKISKSEAIEISPWIRDIITTGSESDVDCCPENAATNTKQQVKATCPSPSKSRLGYA
jgi:hypothetical protein